MAAWQPPNPNGHQDLVPERWERKDVDDRGVLVIAQLLTVKQVAGQLGVSRSTLYKMLDDRVFPAAPIRLPGNNPRWPQEVVDEWVDTRRCD